LLPFLKAEYPRTDFEAEVLDGEDRAIRLEVGLREREGLGTGLAGAGLLGKLVRLSCNPGWFARRSEV